MTVFCFVCSYLMSHTLKYHKFTLHSSIIVPYYYYFFRATTNCYLLFFLMYVNVLQSTKNFHYKIIKNFPSYFERCTQNGWLWEPMNILSLTLCISLLLFFFKINKYIYMNFCSWSNEFFHQIRSYICMLLMHDIQPVCIEIHSLETMMWMKKKKKKSIKFSFFLPIKLDTAPVFFFFVHTLLYTLFTYVLLTRFIWEYYFPVEIHVTPLILDDYDLMYRLMSNNMSNISHKSLKFQ